MTTQPAAASMKDRNYSRKEVVEIIRSVLGSIDQENEPTKKLHDELAALAHYIENTKAELAQMRSIEISHNHIPSATDELDAIVGETAKATGTIMDTCEKIEGVANEVDPKHQALLTGAVTAIYEACSFQDITGQRITKVVKTLKNIEKKVSDILAAFGHAQQGHVPPDKKEEKSLLNGPQLNGPATSQEEIDRLLASFD